MPNSKTTKISNKKNFFSTKVFLALIGLCLVAISLFLWKNQESRNLSQLYSHTESMANSYSSETEIRYNRIYQALNKLANQGIPDPEEDADKWGKDVDFFIASFSGIKSIAWVDKSFYIRLIAPLEGHQAYLNQKANEIILGPSEVNLWVPVYKGTQLEGFILGTINIDAFIAPVISDIKNDFMLKLANEGKTVFISENWDDPREEFVIEKNITLQNTVVLNLSFAPTEGLLKSETANTQKTLFLGLSFTFITIVAVYFAQSYSALSKLNKARYHDLLENVELVAVILDVNGRVTFCNDYLLALTGWKREEILGEDWFVRFVPADWKQVKELFLAALPSGIIQAHHENPIMTRSGELRWLMFNNTVLLDTKGRIIGIASLAEDITERKQAEEEVLASSSKLKTALASMSDAVFISDMDGRFIEFNDAFATFHRFSSKDECAKTLAEYPEFLEVFKESGELASLEEWAVPRALRGETGVNVEYSQRRKDTGEAWVGSYSFAPIRDRDGTIVGSVVVGRDITERKQAEEVLRESEDKFKHVFNHSVVGMSLTLFSGEVNANHAFCEMLGYSHEELKSRKWQEISHPDDIGLNQNLVDSLLAGEGESIRFIKRYIHKNGSTIWADVGTSLRRDKDGNPQYFITSINDITERKQAQEEIVKFNIELEKRVVQRTLQLEAANKELEAFSYSVSHDLRAPLRGIDGWSLALLEDYGTQIDEQARTYLNRVRSETQRMGQLIDDLLNLSRLTRTEMHVSLVDLSVVAGGIAVQLRESDPNRQVEFVIGSGLSSNGDAHLLEIALTNLLGNAFKFSANNMHARVEFGQINIEGQQVFFVRDNGAGFDMAYAKKLFGVFQRMHTVNEFPGSGIGLTIVQRIIHRHGGRIWAEAAINQGATFYFTLEENL